MNITIIGAGKQGISIAQALAVGGHDITVIDKDQDLIDKLGSRIDIRCVCADARNFVTLKTSRALKTDLLIACTDSDDKNAVLCSVGKELGIKKCFARARVAEKMDQIDILKRAMKIDEVINSDYLCANEIYKNLMKRSSFGEGYKMINGIALIGFDAERLPVVIGKPLKEATASFDGLLVAAVSRNGKILIPNGDTEFRKGDYIYAVGSRTNARLMRDSLQQISSDAAVKNVMVAGGGKTSLFLSKQLLAYGVNVKIIESSKKRAEYLAATLENASVIYGDATDSELLFEEDLESMDAFVACTGVDEENFMLAVYAKQQGVKHSIAKLTKNSYGLMLNNIGDISTINPIELCTNYVLRAIADDENLVFSKLIQGQAEFIELNVTDSMPIRNKCIREINVPGGILIAAVFRNGEMITPSGSTRIETGDRILIFAMLAQIPEIQTVFQGIGGEEL